MALDHDVLDQQQPGVSIASVAQSLRQVALQSDPRDNGIEDGQDTQASANELKRWGRHVYLISNYIRLQNHNRIAKVKMARGIKIVIRARGPILPGSISTANSRCGTPNCVCKASPPKLHGTYYR